MTNDEKMLFTNTFGSVTDKRVILNYKGGSENMLLSQISSVAYIHSRNYFQSVGGFIMALIILFIMISQIDEISGGTVLFIVLLIIFLLLSGLANWIGHHNIVITIAGTERRPLKAELAKTREGRELVDAIRKAITK